MTRHLDRATLATLAVTLLLLAASILTQGITHDLFLEGAVFLVSVKLVISSWKAAAATEEIQRKLDEIHSELVRPGSSRAA